MKIGNIGYRLCRLSNYQNKRGFLFYNTIDIHLLRGIYVIDLNYISQRYGNTFIDLINSKLGDFSIFNLNDKDTINILNYLEDSVRVGKGIRKIHISFGLIIDGLYKFISLKKLISCRTLRCFSVELGKFSYESEKEAPYLSIFTDLYSKSLDRDLLKIVTSPDKLLRLMEDRKDRGIDIVRYSTFGLKGLILMSLLCKCRNKNYLRI